MQMVGSSVALQNSEQFSSAVTAQPEQSRRFFYTSDVTSSLMASWYVDDPRHDDVS